ncbi:flagellar motor switch protein FliM [Gemmobacter lanyuensis]|uniref:Flagellar motor switch protein FliM n=1 Tax=Gemmobacter lanyuensis TaxID=1054497 RepID=A0A918IKP1_9RHOB|nr:flagellar motor switch protein FliM [Gemmobacter lanyuensis]GGW21447.1 flagellar motor switch protein FliM [Gemmobacter lanyuensis]
MAKPRKLSSNEVAALVGGLIDMDLGANAGAEGSDVRPYVFGANDLSLVGDYYGLRMINERFCRIARAAFLPMLRFQPRISCFPPEIRTFDDYRNGQENFVSLTQSRIEELRGNQLIVIPPSFVWMLTDAYYGGSIRTLKSSRTEFTGTEQRVIELITDRLNHALQLAWRDLMTVTFNVSSREENMQFAAFVDGEDHVVNCSFMVQLPGLEPASFDILYPLQALKPISGQLRSRMQSDFIDENDNWRSRLERAVMAVPLTVSARLAEPEMSLRQVLQMQEGDVVPVSLSETVEVMVEGVPLFRARPGAIRGHAALSVTQSSLGAGQSVSLQVPGQSPGDAQGHMAAAAE